MIMEGDPFVLIEGMAIAGLAVGATKGYVYIRSEYPHAIATHERGDRDRARGAACSAPACSARRRPSTWRCASAPAPMSAARRPRCSKASKASAAMVRAKPPLPAHQGPVRQADGHQQRDLAGLRADHPGQGRAAFYADFGMGRSRGTMPIQLAGNIKHGGLFETAFGLTLGEIVDDIGGGTATRPAGAGGAGRRAARRLFPARAVRHAVRLRGVRRARTG